MGFPCGTCFCDVRQKYREGGLRIIDMELEGTNMNITLGNGKEMPVIGIGTFQLTPDEAENSVDIALRNGYRLIDTANAYVNV